MDKKYICTKSCTSSPCQYIFGKIYSMDDDGCIYGEDGCGRYLEDTDSEFRPATKDEIEHPPIVMSESVLHSVQKFWYLEGWNDQKNKQKPQFKSDDDYVYQPIRLDPETYEHIRQKDYENGKKDMMEEFLKDAISCNVLWYDGPYLDYTQEQQDEVLEKIGANVDDKVKLIILKDND